MTISLHPSIDHGVRAGSGSFAGGTPVCQCSDKPVRVAIKGDVAHNHVFIFGRRQEALDAAVADLGPNARSVKGSVSDEADLDRLYAAVKAERGTLDIVFRADD